MQVHADLLGSHAEMTLEIRPMVNPTAPGGCAGQLQEAVTASPQGASTR